MDRLPGTQNTVALIFVSSRSENWTVLLLVGHDTQPLCRELSCITHQLSCAVCLLLSTLSYATGLLSCGLFCITHTVLWHLLSLDIWHWYSPTVSCEVTALYCWWWLALLTHRPVHSPTSLAYCLMHYPAPLCFGALTHHLVWCACCAVSLAIVPCVKFKIALEVRFVTTSKCHGTVLQHSRWVEEDSEWGVQDSTWDSRWVTGQSSGQVDRTVGEKHEPPATIQNSFCTYCFSLEDVPWLERPLVVLLKKKKKKKLSH